mgnify:CR=1 FL=1
MIIPSNAKVIGSNKRLKYPLIFFVGIFFVLLSLIAMFGFCVSIDLDIEYDDINPTLGGLLILLTVVVCLSICGISGGVIIYGLTRKHRCKYVEVLIDSGNVYFKEKDGCGIGIEFKNIIGYDDDKEYINTYYDIGSKKGSAAKFHESFGALEIKYRDFGEVKKIRAYVEKLGEAKNEISSAIATSRGQVLNGELFNSGEKLSSMMKGYYVIAYVVLFGMALIFGMIMGFQIEDAIDFDKKISAVSMVAHSILAMSGLPLFILIMITFSIHRHQPHYVILYNSKTRTYYLFKKGKYIEVPVSDIIKTKTRHTKVFVATGKSYDVKNYSTGLYEKRYVYEARTLPEGRVTIKYKKNGFTHTYWTYVNDVDDTTF